MLPYRLDTIQVYCPASLGTRYFSSRYQIEVLRYESSRLRLKSSPSFSQVYLSGGVPFASHLSLTEWDAGQALNALFKASGLEKTGFPKKKEGQLKQTRVYTLHSSLVFLWVCPRRSPAIRGSNLGLWQPYLGWNWRDTNHFDSKDDYVQCILVLTWPSVTWSKTQTSAHYSKRFISPEWVLREIGKHLPYCYKLNMPLVRGAKLHRSPLNQKKTCSVIFSMYM